MSEKKAAHLCTGPNCWICGEPTELRAMRNDISKAFVNNIEIELGFGDSRKLARIAALAIREDVMAMLTKIEELWNALHLARRGPLTRVEIDPNVRCRGNQTRAGLRDVHGPIAVGQLVTVYESEDGIEGEGWVTDIDEGKGLVYLRVNWPSLKDKENGE